MRKIYLALLSLTCLSAAGQIVSDSATSALAVGVQDVNFVPTTNSISSCASTLTVNVPAGNWVYGVDVYYTVNTVGGFTGMSPAGIYSYLECTSKSAKEAQVYQGTIPTNGASENMSRTNLQFINGSYAGTSLDFKLHAFDIAFFSSGCDTNDAKIQAGTFKVVVHHGPAPTCNKPSNLGSDWTMHDRASLNWTSGGAANWQIAYGAPGLAAGAGTIVNASSNPFVLFGLSPSTNYEYYVRDSCGVNDVSVWEGPFSFSTLCNPQTFTTSYSEDFEGAAWTNGAGGTNANNAIDNCWTRNPDAPTGGFGGGAYAWGTGNGGTPTANTGPSGAHLGSKYIYAEASSGQNQDIAVITSPLIDLTALTTPTLEFYYHRYGASVGGLKAQVWSQSLGWTDVWTKTGSQDQSATTDAWIKESITLTAFVNDTVRVRFRAVRSFQPQGDMAIDELEIKEAPNCPNPASLSVNGRTTSSVSLSWSSVNASSWQVEYGPTGFSQGAGSYTVVNSNPGTITGLTSGTVYDFYIRSICGGGDTSGWIGPVTAMPYCASVAAPYSENFDGSGWTAGTGTYNAADALATCWWRNPNAGTGATDPVYWGVRSIPGTTPNTGPDQDHTGGNFVYLESSAGSTGQTAGLESPLIDLSPLVSPELRFHYHMYGNSMGSLRVDIYDANSSTWFNGIWTQSGQQHTAATDPYTEAIVDLSLFAGDSIIVRFSGIKGNERRGDMAIDDVRIDEAPACPQPTMLSSSNVTTTSVDISWTSGGASNWQIEYGPSGFTPGIGQGTIVNASSNPYTLNLGSSQVYDIYVRDSCGLGNVSAWTGPEPVSMPCGIAVIPWLETFDGSNWIPGFGGTNNGNVISACWSRPSFANPNFGTNAGGTGSANTGPNADVSGNGQYIYTEASGGATGPGEITSPQIILSSSVANPTLTFYYHMYGNAIDSLYVEINNGSGWTQIYSIAGQQQTSNGAAWNLVQQSLLAYSGDTVQLRFTGVNSGFAADIAIDEVAIQDVACPQSSNFAILNVSSSSVELDWTSGGAPGFRVEYGPSGFALGTGTTVSAGSSPFILNGLSAGTTYDFYLRDSCGATSYGPWIGPISGTTLCNTFTAPYTENFDDSTWVVGLTTNNNQGNRINNCWTRPSDNNPNFGPYAGQTASANTGPLDDVSGGGKYIYTEFSGVNGFGEISSPEILIPTSIANPVVQFDYFLFGAQIDSLSVYVDQGGSLTWITSLVGPQQTSINDSWLSTNGDLSPWSGDTIRVVFRGYSTGFQGDIAIDEFKVFDDPCPKPSNLQAGTVTKNSISLSWTSGGASNWQIEYGSPGFQPGTGTIVNAGTNPFTVTGLNASTYYEFYVRDSCSATDLSLWLGPILQATLCDTVAAPYFENFDIAFDRGTDNAQAQNMGSTISPCWTRDSDTNYFWGGGTGQTPTAGTGPFGDHTGGGNYIFVESSFAPGGSTAWIETPYIDLSPLSFPELRFWYQMWAQNGSQGDLYWEIDSGNGVWNQIGTYSGSQGFAWQEQVDDLRDYAGKTVKLRFRAIKSNGATAQQGDIAIDDLSIIEGPACPDGDSLQLVSRSSNSLNISWVGASATDFNVTWQNVSGGGNGSANTSVSNYNITGLSASSAYVVCVRDSCGPGQVANWLCDTFYTLCNPVGLPFTENFDGGTWTAGTGALNDGNVIDNCWDRPSEDNPNFGTGTGATGSAGTGPATDVSGNGNYLYTEYSAAAAAFGEIYSPYIVITSSFSNPELSFAYHMFGNQVDSLSVWAETASGLSWLWSASGAQQSANNDPFLNAQVNMSAFSGDTIRILFRGHGSGFASDIAIDEVEIDSVSCPIPTSLSAGATTTTTVPITWVSSGANSILEYGSPGYTVGSGTSVAVSGGSSTLTGLQPGTYYDLYLRDVCGPGDSSAWYGPISFVTQCGTYIAPYYESFDNGFSEGTGALNTGATISPCWTRNTDSLFFWGGGQGGTPSGGTGPTGDKTSGTGGYVYTEASAGAGGDTAILESGLIDMSALSNPELRFWYHMFSQNGQNLWFQWEIQSGGSWTVLGTLSGDQGDTWIEQRNDLASYTNQTVKFRFLVVKPTGAGAFTSDVAIDEMVVDEKIACNPYTMPFVENFDGSTWQEGTGALNDNDQIDPCWIRPNTTQMRWGTGSGTTASANTGPNTDISGSGNYIYTEASRGAGATTISTPPIIVDTAIAAPHIFYSYHMYGASIVNLSIEIDNGSPVLLRTHLGQQQTSSAAAWISDSIDITAYQGDTITITFVGDATTFTGDMALDGIEVRDAILPCPDPTNLTISAIGQNDFTMAWSSSNGPNTSIITYYDIAAGPGTMVVLTGLNSPYTLSGLNPNANYAISVYDSCSVGQFSGNLFDTVSTLPCDTVTANFSNTNAYLGVTYDGGTSVNADTLIWDYGDGNSGGGNPVNHVYAAAGVYNVSLYALNDCGTGDTLTLPIRVCDTLTPQQSFTVYSDSLVFDASGSNANSFRWDFGDGSTDTNRMGSYVYALSGTYTVSLTVYNLCGDSATVSQSVQICGAPKADWTYTVLPPVNNGLRIQFDASASTNASSYAWDFGDGNTGTGVNPIHIYVTPGLFYYVKLTVTNACNNTHAWGWNLYAIGLEEQDGITKVEVYPNPADDVLMIEWDAEQFEMQSLYLRDASGRILQQVKPDQSPYQWDVSRLPAGTYFLEMTHRHGQQSLPIVIH